MDLSCHPLSGVGKRIGFYHAYLFFVKNFQTVAKNLLWLFPSP
jgi:hypothetical protein